MNTGPVDGIGLTLLMPVSKLPSKSVGFDSSMQTTPV